MYICINVDNVVSGPIICSKCEYDKILFRLTMKISKPRVTGLLWRESAGHRWFLRKKGQYCGKCFHVMTSQCHTTLICMTIGSFVWFMIHAIHWGLNACTHHWQRSVLEMRFQIRFHIYVPGFRYGRLYLRVLYIRAPRAAPSPAGSECTCNRPGQTFPRDHYCNFQNVTLSFNQPCIRHFKLPSHSLSAPYAPWQWHITL